MLQIRQIQRIHLCIIVHKEPVCYCLYNQGKSIKLTHMYGCSLTSLGHIAYFIFLQVRCFCKKANDVYVLNSLMLYGLCDCTLQQPQVLAFGCLQQYLLVRLNLQPQEHTKRENYLTYS